LPDTSEEKLSRLERIERAQGNVDREALADDEHTSLLLHVADVETTADRALGAAPTIRTAATTAQSAVSALGHVVAPLAGAIPTPATAVVNVAETARHLHNVSTTYAHISRLQEIRNECRDEAMREILEYAIRQKNRKLKSEGLAAMPVASVLNTLYAKGHALRKIYRGTKGVERMNYAEELWQRQQLGNDDARLACAELMGSEDYVKYKDTVDGRKKLAAKLKSR
jgi:hypothetical protein